MYYDGTDISEGTDPATSNKSKECIIASYWFSSLGFESHNSVDKGFHELTILCFNVKWFCYHHG